MKEPEMKNPEMKSHGAKTILGKMKLAGSFGALLGGLFRGQGFLGDYWPVLLIAAGLLILVNGFIKWKD